MSFSSYNNLKYLFIFYPIFFLTGSFLTDLCLIIVGFQFLIFSIVRKNTFPYNSIFSYIFLCFYFIIILSGILSNNAFESLFLHDGPFFYFRYLFFTLGIIHLLQSDKNILRYFFICLMASITFLIIDTLFQWVFNFNLLGIENNNPRISSVFGEEKILGHYLGYVSPIFFSLSIYFFKDKKIYMFVSIIIFLLTIFISIISGDRTGFLKLLLFSFAIVFFMNHHRKYFLLLIFTFSIFSYQLIKNDQNINLRFHQTIDEITNTSVPFLPFTKAHENHFKASYKMFLDKPIIGHGPQAFRLVCHNFDNYKKYNGCNNHPHNYYVQSLSELGLLGFLFTFFIFVWTLIYIAKSLYSVYFTQIFESSKRVLILLICAFTLNIFPVMAHFNFYNNWVNAILFLNISLILFFYKINNNYFNSSKNMA